MRKICVITGSRADYGILSGLMRLIQVDTSLELQVIVTNMHLSPEFGLTYREIESDGFIINKKVEMLVSSDTRNAISKSVGLATIGFADAYEDLKPDLVLVLGDRSEILSAVQTALFYNIPIAHLHGGEITEGAYDDCIRHAITKMSHLHFASTNQYQQRIIQLGEQPNRVFNVGSLGVENIRNIDLLSKRQIEDSLEFELTDKCILVTFHPVTLETFTSKVQMKNLIESLNSLNEYKVIFTQPNSDKDGRIIMDLINEYVGNNTRKAKAFTSLGMKRYLSLLQFVNVVVGNSSSGIIEVPSFKIPTLNIGTRQSGRIASESVIHCDPDLESINQGLIKVLSQEHIMRSQLCHNPYEKEGTSNEILKVLKYFPLEGIIQKKFYNIDK